MYEKAKRIRTEAKTDADVSSTATYSNHIYSVPYIARHQYLLNFYRDYITAEKEWRHEVVFYIMLMQLKMQVSQM